MQSRALKFAASVLILMYAGGAVPQPPPRPTLQEVAMAYQKMCSQEQAPPTYCSCMVGKIIAITDPALAEQMVTTGGELTRSFFKRADPECSLDDFRKSVKAACLEDAAAQPQISFDAEAACHCLEERVRELDDQVLLHEAIAARRNNQARIENPVVKLYESKIDRLRGKCERQHPKRRPLANLKHDGISMTR